MKHKYDVQNNNWIENMKRIIYENGAEKNWIIIYNSIIWKRLCVYNLC